MPKKQQNENDEREIDTVELGGVYFNIRTHEIVGFIPAKKLQTEIEVDLIALSVDPHADRYWWVTPYAYCNNNPIKIEKAVSIARKLFSPSGRISGANPFIKRKTAR